MTTPNASKAVQNIMTIASGAARCAPIASVLSGSLNCRGSV